MCIVLLTTAHPHYPLILLDNRDEFFGRPTQPVSWHGQILAPQDLQREAHGSWIGISRSGRFAVLTNFHEPQPRLEPGTEPISRGLMVREWLEDESVSGSAEDLDKWREKTLGDGKGDTVGGFSMILGIIEKDKEEDRIKPLSVISNRPLIVPGNGRAVVARPNTVDGLSNASFCTEVPWPKVYNGTNLLEDAIRLHAAKYTTPEPTVDSEENLIEILERIMKTNSLPPVSQDSTMAEVGPTLRNSIFIPAVGSPDTEKQSPHTGLYGTTQQTVLLLNNQGQVTYIERTTKTGGLVKEQFKIDGWSSQ